MRGAARRERRPGIAYTAAGRARMPRDDAETREIVTDGSTLESSGEGAAWACDPLHVVWRRPLPHMAGEPMTRFLCRAVTATFQHRVVVMRGIERVAPDRDPFVMILNHNMKLEAILLPTLFNYLRHGKLIRFMADWNFQLIPVVGALMRHGRVITVAQKPARPKLLNVFRPLFRHETSAFSRARACLDAGGSVGIFIEGTINRSPDRLLPGHPGAARLSLESRIPVLPVGVRFPEHGGDEPIRSTSRMALSIGQPLEPPRSSTEGRAPRAEVHAWHETMMRELARLSGKRFTPRG